MSTGADLENAIMTAARVYQKQDRAELVKQHTPRLHSGFYRARAPIDFKGWANPGRQPLYIEAKATSDGKVAFTNVGDGIKEVQFEAMKTAVARRIRMLLVVWFVPENEMYAIDAQHVVDFAAIAWRKSLSLYWCRARGDLMRFDGRRAWFLDAAPHPFQATAEEAVRAECEGKKVIELFPSESTAVTQGAEKLTKEQRLAGVRDAVMNGKYRRKSKGWI